MPARLPTTLIVLACLLAGGGSVRAEGPLFAPPAAAPPLAPHAAPPDGVRVAWARGVSSPGQPVVGRYGLFAPPPLTHVDLPVSFQPGPDPTPGQDEQQSTAKTAKPAPLPEVQHAPIVASPGVCEAECRTGDFSADAFFAPYDACSELQTYNGKKEVDTQRPLVELGIPFYQGGPHPAASELLGPTNLVQQKFYVYGDYRVGMTQADLGATEETTLAHRLNLELDYWITSTERVHAFVGPFQEDARFMRVVDGKYFEELDFFQADTDTLFFEGDLGAMIGGYRGEYASFDMPVTMGLVPLLFQNGVWALDAIVGGAVTIPARNSATLDWSNFDVTFFGGVDRISSGAFGFDDDAAALIGATTFIDVRSGYLELGYAFVDDQEGAGRSYHNMGVSYTRRYANLVSNSVRLIANVGQDTGSDRQTADGVLLLVENSFLTANPYNVIPYVNFFAGFDRPQPLARAGAFGGVLFNTGILFQADQLTSYPTLEPSGNNTYGAAAGIDFLSPAFNQQLILEVAVLGTMGERIDRVAPGDQVGLGMRWQKQLTTAHLLRADAMVGVLEDSEEIAGARIEYRWKF
ncbi:hypothetical protein [Botrimarina hoheduenensis]|uniref:Alginate export domain-containing protein n=1 Tax=Botrimarina hoheduenensis TaxID=2528000 RepID=A0A5C5W0D9_9BACT|nr:hypothetical protein [Botrimarina hoheduenensis]TWT43431.1 hypothetical protein Pla111_23820 [Botrimarina hoheduenensis]